MKLKTKLKRKNLIGLSSLVMLSLILVSLVSVQAGDAELVSMEYNKFVTPVDHLNIVITMQWETLAQRVDGNMIVYYTVNSAFDLKKAASQSFTPSNPKAEQFYLSLKLAGLHDEDIIRFKVWFKWRGYVAGKSGEILTELGKSSYETGKVPTTNFETYSTYIYAGVGVIVLVAALYIVRKVRMKKKS